MVADLLSDEMSRVLLWAALADEYFSKEGVQRLLHPIAGITTRVLLALEAGQEPLQHTQYPFCWVWLVSWSTEQVRLLYPVSWKLSSGFVC